MKKGVTIYDIAKELDVSPSTVSRALKDHHSIGKKTRKAVKEVANLRGYRPNQIASSLRNNKTNTIGVIISWINRPFISSVISGIEEEVNKAGYNVIISQSHDSFDHEVTNANALFNGRVAGLIVSLAMETKNYDHFKNYINNNVPVIFVDRVTDKLRADRIIIDNYKAAYDATSHLIDQGCKRIAHLGGQTIRNVYRERQAGFIDALKEHGLPVYDEYIINSSLSAEEGTKASKELFSMKERPDGLFCANDTSAVSAIQEAKREGIKVPEELAVIGFNNDPISSIIEPQLSTVDHPAVEMGVISAKQILRRLNEENSGNINKFETVIMDTNVLVRGSSNRKGHRS
jgi:DNA-binding LacI/PurR family transcriptional regulator